MYEVTSSNLMIPHLVVPHLIWLKSTNKKRPNVGLVEGNREKGKIRVFNMKSNLKFHKWDVTQETYRKISAWVRLLSMWTVRVAFFMIYLTFYSRSSWEATGNFPGSWQGGRIHIQHSVEETIILGLIAFTFLSGGRLYQWLKITFSSHWCFG